MVYCAVVGCYNHSNKKSITEKINYFRLHLMKVFVGPGWEKLGGKTSHKITIAFVFPIYILKKININAV